MTTLPKWTDELTAQLTAAVGSEHPVTKATVDAVAAQLGTSGRSVAAKLRKLGHDVELASAAPKAFSDDEAAQLRAFLETNDGTHTYGEVAAAFAGGKYTAKQIQGKILSMELTGSVKPTPKAEVTKTYTDEQQATVLAGIKAGKFVEDIAAEVGKEVTSVRGKALSLFRNGDITEMPKQRDVKGAGPDAFDALGDVSKMTVAEIAAKLTKTERGVKTMLTRRKVNAADYKGADKAAKTA